MESLGSGAGGVLAGTSQGGVGRIIKIPTTCVPLLRKP